MHGYSLCPNHTQGVSAAPVSDDNMFQWDATIIGPEETAWEGTGTCSVGGVAPHRARARAPPNIACSLFATHLLPNPPGGMFTLRLSFPDTYPDAPPKARFVCEMYHPNGSVAGVGLALLC